MSALDRVITVCPQCAGVNTHILAVTDMPKRMKNTIWSVARAATALRKRLHGAERSRSGPGNGKGGF